MNSDSRGQGGVDARHKALNAPSEGLHPGAGRRGGAGEHEQPVRRMS